MRILLLHHLQKLLRAHRNNQWRLLQRVGLTLTYYTVAGSNPEQQETGTDKSTADSQTAPSAGSGGSTDTSELCQGSEENPPPPPPPEAAQSTQEQPMEAAPEGRADTDTVACSNPEQQETGTEQLV